MASLEAHSTELWNWWAAAVPGVSDWAAWLNDVAGQLLRQAGPVRVRVAKTNLVEPGLPAERIAFDGPSLGIGRAAENGIVLAESTVTRQHARLRRAGDSVLLEDLGSAMGTLVNGTRLAPMVPVEMTDGDVFVIFPHRFEVAVEREWVAGEGVRLSESRPEAASWAEFSEALPAGWNALSLDVSPLERCAALAVSPDCLRLLTAAVLAPIEDAGDWLPSNEAIVELVLLAALERANRDLAFPFQVSMGRMRRRARIAGKARGIAVSAVMDVAGFRSGLRVFLPFDLLRAMRERWTPRTRDGLAGRASWRFPFSAGHVELTREEQASIERGDVVIYTAEPALLLPGDDRRGYRADWDGGGRVRLSDRFDRRLGMADAVGARMSFDDLPVRVQVLVDEHEMTFAEAERLAPGALIELNRDPRDPVTLAVNGRVIGSGELVEVDGRLGVKILSWSER
jgi:pSer/pThr/pTyr-binding forkhead associated (FHA) protein